MEEPHSLGKHDYPFSQRDLQMASMRLFSLHVQENKRTLNRTLTIKLEDTNQRFYKLVLLGDIAARNYSLRLKNREYQAQDEIL